MKKIIDISQFNGDINYTRLNANIEGAIVRAGYRGYGKGTLVTDSKFAKNILNISKPLGVYFVTQAITEAEAREEARYTINLVKAQKKALNYPIFIDSEDCGNGQGRADRSKLGKAKRTAIIKAFCEEVEKNGYKSGVYASESWFKNQLDVSQLNTFLWVAKYSAYKPSIRYDAWQFTDKARVSGINANVDMSYFENEGTTPQPTPKKTNEEIAEEVMQGKWGNGNDRKKRLTDAGYNYNDIQAIVNKKLTPKVTKVYHTIKKGENLTMIAKKYGTTVNKLKTLNGIKNANLIYAGQTIRIK